MKKVELRKKHLRDFVDFIKARGAGICPDKNTERLLKFTVPGGVAHKVYPGVTTTTLCVPRRTQYLVDLFYKSRKRDVIQDVLVTMRQPVWYAPPCLEKEGS